MRASVALPILPHKPGVVAYAVRSIIWMYAPMSEISILITRMLPSFCMMVKGQILMGAYLYETLKLLEVKFRPPLDAEISKPNWT
jgi:hypothetical protein